MSDKIRDMQEEISRLNAEKNKNAEIIEAQKKIVAFTQIVEKLRDKGPKYMELKAREKVLKAKIEEATRELEKRKGLEERIIMTL
jgi:arginine utilization protein RocB